MGVARGDGDAARPVAGQQAGHESDSPRAEHERAAVGLERPHVYPPHADGQRLGLRCDVRGDGGIDGV